MKRIPGGMLITLEGIDGSGKSTLAHALAQQLRIYGYDVVQTKEPGGSALGKKLRELLQTQPVPITPHAEFLLFAADRAQHFHDVIIPARNRDAIVISDRMADSSIVYQGYGRGLSCDMIRQVNAWVMQSIVPDLTFYLRIEAGDAAHRLQGRPALTVFEQEQTQFTKRLMAGFDTIFKNQQHVVTLDAMQSPEKLTTHALTDVHQWITSHHAIYLK